MRVTPEQFAALRDAVLPLMQRWPRHAYQDITDKRWRWDCLHASGFSTSRLYDDGLNDHHVDTALRQIALMAAPLGGGGQ